MSHNFRVEKDWVTVSGLRAVVGVVVMDGHDSHRCGYVAVGRDHPLYGEDYNNLYEFKVHGCLTYASCGHDGHPVASQDLWWFGFDAAHYMDGSMYSRMQKYKPSDASVRSELYMVQECNSLAQQLANYKAPSLTELLRSDRELSLTKRAEIAAILDTLAALSTQIKGA